uniref:Uncharacterized protein n=1 Tax=Leersia perrieri TaxID=77586 RepID=A0A0D9W494_9ORYZ
MHYIKPGSPRLPRLGLVRLARDWAGLRPNPRGTTRPGPKSFCGPKSRSAGPGRGVSPSSLR